MADEQSHPAAASASATTSATPKTAFAKLPSTMISRLGPYLGETAASRDVRAFACVSSKVNSAIQRMPVLGLRIDNDDAKPILPDGSLCLTEKQAVARVLKASRVVQTVTLTGFATDEGLGTILRSCDHLRTLSVESQASIDWSKDTNTSPLSTSLQSLSLRSCFSMVHLQLMLAKLPGLRSLTISNCPDITQDDFEAMGTSALAHLTSLRLVNCLGITDFAAAEVFKRIGSSLTTLSVSGCRNISSTGIGHALSRAPLLTSLDMCQCPRIGSEICKIISEAGLADTLRVLRLPSSVTDGDLVSMITGATATAPVIATASSASSGSGVAASKPTGLVRLRHLGLTGSGVSDTALRAVLSHLPGLHVLDLQLCSCLSFRVVDLIVESAKSLERLDVRGHRRLRGDDVEKIIHGIPSICLVVGDPTLISDSGLKSTAGARSVVLRAKPGLSAD